MVTPASPIGQPSPDGQLILGRYRITARLGAGGMGEVYRARDTNLERDVAIKILPASADEDDDARKRFRREAKTLCRLNHPNIAVLHDFVTEAGRDYLVMEFIDGISLDDKLAAGAIPEREVLRLGIQLAEGVAAAHERGIIHGDLKPANLRVTPDGWLKVLDFGLARQIASLRGDAVSQTLSQIGGVAGTLRYMAPEQVEGKPLDPRSDIFALGAILYEMATGQAPLQAETTAALVEAILHKAPAPPRRLNTAVSPRLEDVILKCLEKEPENRYQSAKEIAIDLRRLAPTSMVTELPAPKPRLPLRNAAIGALAAVVIVGAFLGVGAVRRRIEIGSSPAHTIAVLPLRNMSGDSAQDFFAEGMTEAVTADLARMESLQVISHSTAMQYADSKKPIPEIARDLNADTLVEGSVQRVGERVRITAELIRASSDRHLWANSYERDAHDILSLEDEVSSAIAEQIARRLGVPGPAALPKTTASVDPQAYETYLKANYFLDRWDLSKSIDYLNEAIKLDPNYAPSYAQLARAYFFLAFGEAIPPKEGWGKVKDAATLALAKDDRLPEAHGAMALAKMNLDWDFAGAEREFQRALQLNPNEADIRHDYAHYLAAMGRMQDSEQESRRALDLNPMGDSLVGCLCWHSFSARNYDQSIELAQKVLTANPDDPWELSILGWDYEQKGKYDEAITAFKHASDASKGEGLYVASLGHAYAVSGRRNAAEQVLNTLLSQRNKRYVSAFDIAVIYIGLGDKDKAFEWLDKAVDERSTFLVYSRWEPRLDPLRSDPRFNQLLSRIGLPQ